MVRCLIVDDEPLALDILKKYISSIPGLELAGDFTKPMEAFAFLRANEIDLLFIDIQMPGLNGLELVRSMKNPPRVIFTTAFREYAVEGFELQVLDYLVKPISPERFLKTIDKFTTTNREAKKESIVVAEDPFVFIKVDKTMVKLRLHDIFFVEALKNYVRIKIPQKDLITYHTLNYMQDKLPEEWFYRIHKSYLINLNKIDKYGNDSVEINGKILPVGKTFRDGLSLRLSKKSL
jgi:DNA-binding LytR/AlgR family response regulator